MFAPKIPSFERQSSFVLLSPLPSSPLFSSSPAEPEMVPAGKDGVCGLMAY